MTRCQLNLKLSIRVASVGRVSVNMPRRRLQIRRLEGDVSKSVMKRSNYSEDTMEENILNTQSGSDCMKCDLIFLVICAISLLFVLK